MAETKKTNSIHCQFNGEVIKKSGMKTIQVLVKTKVTHPKYKKQYPVSKKYAVHDEQGLAKIGDLVIFQECRPLSKMKRWRLVKIQKQA